MELMLERLNELKNFFAEHTAMWIEDEVDLEFKLVASTVEWIEWEIAQWASQKELWELFETKKKYLLDSWKGLGNVAKIFFEGWLDICEAIINWDEEEWNRVKWVMEKIIAIDKEEDVLLSKLV